jgi:membrane peptidoglycan carboxypeptidase
LFGQKAGGSTLTQQFIKNAVLTTEKTYTRKIKELILAYQVEKRFTKDEILQMYLNEIPYGSTAYGIEAASQRYFGKSVRDVNIAEAAILAALPQAPSRYSPYGPNKDLLIARQHYILDLMVEQGYIEEEKAVVAKQVTINFKEQSNNILAPHFVMYVKELLSEKYGEKMVEQEGLKIYTTLDLYKQEIAEKVIAEKTPGNEENYGASNASLVSIDPKTGQILAMVGSRDYFNDDIDGQVNVSLQPRQPGSSFKPIVYAASFIKGYTPDTILYDVVTNFSLDKSEPYEPHNYDLAERGPVTIRKALQGSLNIPAVKTIYLTGIDNVLALAEDLGYSTFVDRNRFGLSLVLGGGEVKLLEHTNAFGAFARDGLVHPTAAILKIEDKDGNLLEEFKQTENRALEEQVARQINNILSDNAARAYAFGENNYLTLGNRPVAAKTGTTNDYRDAWTIGYTPSIVTGVWVGNNDNSEMNRGAGGSAVAAPIWHDYMQEILGDTPIEYFKEPEKITTGKPVLDGQTGRVTANIDKFSGLLATEHTPASAIETKTFEQAHSILYYVNKDDPRGEQPSKPEKDAQFSLWEERILAWAEKEGLTNEMPPNESDNIHLPEYQPSLTVKSPANNQTIMSTTLPAEIETSAPRGINRVEYYINGNLFETATRYPFTPNKSLSFLNNGFYNLTIRACDDVDNCTAKNIEFNLILEETKKDETLDISWNNLSGEKVLSTADFPVELRVNLTNPTQTAKIIFYLKDSENNRSTIATSQLLDNALGLAVWRTSPPSGEYKLWAEAIGWNKQTAQSNEVTITITEPEAPASE